MKLVYKFFIAFFATNLISVLILVLLIGFNLSSSFNELVMDTETAYFEQVKEKLAQSYELHGDWEPVHRGGLWKDIVGSASNQQAADKRKPPKGQPNKRGRDSDRREEHRRKDNDQRPPKPPRRDDRPSRNGHPRNGKMPDVSEISADYLKTGRRISLYDADKQVLVGREDIDSHPIVAPIELDGETVGWLALMPSSLANESPAKSFIKDQYWLILWVSLAVSLLSVLTALLFSRTLVRPIELLARGTRTIRKGNYKVRMEKQSNDELGKLTEDVNELAATLDYNQKNRQQWMSDTSHELRTPLTVIKSQLIAIQDGVMKLDDQRIELLVDEVEGLNRLVDDLYQLSSGDLGAMNYSKQPIAPLSILKQIVEAFSPKFAEKNIRIENNLNTDSKLYDTPVFADAGRIKQLFTNLLENACRYTNEGGQVKLNATIDKKTLVIDLQDSAPGVTDEQLKQLADRFYRADKSRSRQSGGSGLGLALCKQIVEAHQGTMVHTHSPLGGIRTIIRLPVYQ